MSGGGRNAADIVVVTNIIRQVLSVDKDYEDRRAAWPDVVEETCSYYLWRRKLLSKAGRAGRLVVGGRTDRRNDYLVLRERELARRFPSPSSAAAAPANSPQLSPSTQQQQQLPHTVAGNVTNSDVFAFAGLHHVFGEQRHAVNVVKFANDTKDLLAFGCADGTVSVCTVVSRPARVALLKGHFGPVTDIDWGITNDFLLSASLDKSVRVWQSRCGLCTRIVQTPQACLCCAFHPLNNNFFALGTRAPKGSKGLVQIFNVSTGLCAGSQQTPATVRSLAFDSAGNFLFAGDDSGAITMLHMSPNGALQVLCRKTLSGAVCSVEFKGWSHRGRLFTPLVLAVCRDNAVRVLQVGAKPAGELVLKCTLSVPASKQQVRARFCPLLATRPSPCIVAGGEDGCVYIFDIGRRGRAALINKLQGHATAVHDVSWSYDESLLASCDDSGVVLIWKRVHKVTT